MSFINNNNVNVTAAANLNMSDIFTIYNNYEASNIKIWEIVRTYDPIEFSKLIYLMENVGKSRKRIFIHLTNQQLNEFSLIERQIPPDCDKKLYIHDLKSLRIDRCIDYYLPDNELYNDPSTYGATTIFWNRLKSNNTNNNTQMMYNCKIKDVSVTKIMNNLRQSRFFDDNAYERILNHNLASVQFIQLLSNIQYLLLNENYQVNRNEINVKQDTQSVVESFLQFYNTLIFKQSIDNDPRNFHFLIIPKAKRLLIDMLNEFESYNNDCITTTTAAAVATTTMVATKHMPTTEPTSNVVNGKSLEAIQKNNNNNNNNYKQQKTEKFNQRPVKSNNNTKQSQQLQNTSNNDSSTNNSHSHSYSNSSSSSNSTNNNYSNKISNATNKLSLNFRKENNSAYILQPYYHGIHLIVYSSPIETKCFNRFGELYLNFGYNIRTQQPCTFEVVVLPVDTYNNPRSWRYWPYKKSWIMYIVDVFRYKQTLLVQKPFEKRIKYAQLIANGNEIQLIPEHLCNVRNIYKPYVQNHDIYDPIIGVYRRHRRHVLTNNNENETNVPNAYVLFNILYTFDILDLKVLPIADTADYNINRLHMNLEMADYKVICIAYGHDANSIYLCRYDRTCHHFVHAATLQRFNYENIKFIYKSDKIYVINNKVLPQGVLYLRVYFDVNYNIIGYDTKVTDGRFKLPFENVLYS